ncbi:MAG: hypothetical protein LHV68_04330 [Elusimicrobia bacterium]|nr:hypothetical protein [Candidatus Liberimonas magnetica]
MNDYPQLEEMLLNLKTGRYGLVGMARDWLSYLQRTDEGKLMSRAELIKKSLDDILSGRVKEEDVTAALGKIKNLPPEHSEEKEKEKKG